MMKTLGLYIHIPFCVKKCNYCDFYSIESSEELCKAYIDSVRRELKLWKQKLEADTVIDTVYIGGGTPSILGTELLCNLLCDISDTFSVANNCETTIEANPNSLQTLDLNIIKKYGLNRISMGLQSSNDSELKILGRSHNKLDALNAIEKIHNAGITNFSLDVMTGIPLQTFDSLSETIDFCINSQASHISTYMLKIEKNTPFYTNREKYDFANDDVQADFYEYTCNKLKKSGFRHYEISNFCKNDSISRHNMKYWQLEDYLGIGPSAHSMIDGKRFYYPNNIHEFDNLNVIYESDGKSPLEYIMLSLRTDVGFVFKTYKELFGIIPSSEFFSKVKKFEKYGLMYCDSKSCKLTDKGYLVSNSIISRLLEAENY